MRAPDAGMAFRSSSEETDDSAAASSPSPGPDASYLQRRRRSSKRLKNCSVPAAAVHATAAVLVARVHSELAYAPASRAPEAAHALCLVLDAALRCKSGGIGGGERREGEGLSSTSFSPSAFSSSVSIAKVGAPTELPDAAFVAVALPAKAKTTRPSAFFAGVGGNSSSSSSASDKERSESSSEGERAAAAAAAGGDEELNTAPLVAALLRAAERLHAAVAQVRCCF